MPKHDFEDPEDFLTDPDHPHRSGWIEVAMIVVACFSAIAFIVLLMG